MRIISGSYGGRRLPRFQWKGTRPTQDRVKESYFNIIQNRHFTKTLHFLDLFAGSGSMSLEFLSRHSGMATSIEHFQPAIIYMKNIKRDWEVDQWEIIKEKVERFLNSTKEQFDLIYADPPYNMPNQDKVIEKIFANKLLANDGILVWEHEKSVDFSGVISFKEERRFGDTSLSLFEFE